MTLYTSADDPAAPYIVARDPILDVGSSPTLSLARTLIDECVNGHERCMQISPSSAAPLPTRLVDCTDPTCPRLVSTEGEHGTYLALSYVWGEEQPHKTTISNMTAYSAGIDTSLLPQTIRDAIHVTHTLGFQYLWADSLCILQDSEEDNMHEIGQMHLIYRYAYLTVIAASAERVGDGFLQDRPGAPHDLTLPFICPPCSLAPGDSPADTQQVGKVHHSDWSYNSDPEEPIDRRGWCLQELYMSPRALIFTSKTLRFRCQHTTQNVGNSLYRTHSDVRLPDILFHPAPPLAQHGSKEWCDVHAAWDHIVLGRYNGRTLSKASDKLVACGALAESFHRVLRSEYLAGLWRDTLLHDLLWQSSDDNGDPGHVERPAVYRAPSWSWAAVNGKICSGRPSHRSHVAAVAKVARCEVRLKDPELPFGEVTDGSLVLHARLIRCKVRKVDSRWGADLLVPPPWRWRRLWSLNHAYLGEGDTIEGDGGFRGLCYIDCLADLAIERESEWLVPLFREIDRDTSPSVYGLVVALAHPDSDSKAKGRKVYRRIGTFASSLVWHWDKLKRYVYALEEEEEVEIV